MPANEGVVSPGGGRACSSVTTGAVVRTVNATGVLMPVSPFVWLAVAVYRPSASAATGPTDQDSETSVTVCLRIRLLSTGAPA